MPRKKGQSMSEWQNVGVRSMGVYDLDIPTKKELKRQITETPERVQVYSTDAFGENRGKTWKADNLVIGVKYSVTGPNPYTSRKWYATVEKLANGTIKVS